MVEAGLWSKDMQGEDDMPHELVPEKHVFVIMEAGNDLAASNSLGDHFVYVDVTECRPRWLTEDHQFGKAKTKLDPWIEQAQDDNVETLRQVLNGKSVKPLWFHHDGQFWACW